MEGRSAAGPGGRFRSGRRAQVHLLPSLNDLPYHGRSGELLSIADNPGASDPVASLWLCTRGSDPNRPAEWKQLA